MIKSSPRVFLPCRFLLLVYTCWSANLEALFIAVVTPESKGIVLEGHGTWRSSLRHYQMADIIGNIDIGRRKSPQVYKHHFQVHHEVIIHKVINMSSTAFSLSLRARTLSHWFLLCHLYLYTFLNHALLSSSALTEDCFLSRESRSMRVLIVALHVTVILHAT